MVPETAFRPPLNAVQAGSTDEDASVERWRQWQLRNVEANRKDAKRMRIVFAALFAALGMWLVIQMLAPSLLP
jgi:hypothetical protein